ncbi:MAG: lamin tail domain-containing protein, partial [Bacteroidota bacterium]
MPLQPSLLIAGLLAIPPVIQAQTTAEFDVIINEIMADPTPPQGLPAVEWLELFNRSSDTVELSSLRLKDATGAFFPLPAFSLPPGAFATLTANANVSQLQSAISGTVLGIPVSATFLNNDGDDLTLADSSGHVIDRISYSASWHTSTTKRDGGWSLERINPVLPCLCSSNWNSCNTIGGGTPGAPKSRLSL